MIAPGNGFRVADYARGYPQLERPELLRLLTENNVYNADNTGVINDQLISMLYEKLDQLKVSLLVQFL